MYRQRGLAPDKGGRSAHPGAESTIQGSGGWSKPWKGREAWELRDLGWGLAMVTVTIHLLGLREAVYGLNAGPWQVPGLMRGTWLDPSANSPIDYSCAVRNLCNYLWQPS